MIILFISVQMGKFFLFYVRGSEYQETYIDFSASQRSINSDVMQIQIFFFYCYLNRKELLQGGTKTLKMVSGCVVECGFDPSLFGY